MGAQFLGMTSRAVSVLGADSVVSLTENGPAVGPPYRHHVAPHTCFMSSHFAEFACSHAPREQSTHIISTDEH